MQFLSTKHWYFGYRRWTVGSGSSPKIGLDSLVGITGSHLLSPALVTTLNYRGLHVLKDIAVAEHSSPFYTHWQDAAAISLPDPSSRNGQTTSLI